MLLEIPLPNMSPRCLLLLKAVPILLLLTACSTTGTQQIPEVVMPEEACLQPAEPLPLLKEPSLAAVIRNHVEVADLYWQLAARQQCLIDFERAKK